MRLRFAVVFERLPNNYGAYVPDLPGCISTGETWDEMQQMIREAISFHIEGMLEDGEPVPESRTSVQEAMSYHAGLLSENGWQVRNRTRPSRWSRWKYKLDRPVQSRLERAVRKGL